MTTCPLCGAAEARGTFSAGDRLYGTTVQPFNIVTCDSCGVLYLSPRPPTEELARYYPDGYWWNNGSGSGLAHRLEAAYRSIVLRDHVRFFARAAGPPPARVLDVGCGSGDVLAALERRGYRCVGVDRSPAALAAAARQGVAGLIADHAFRSLASASFDAVCMFHFLEHVPDPSRALEFAREVLRPGGALVVQVPNAASWQAALLGERWSVFDVPRHLINFRARDIERLVSDTGFRVTRRKYFSLRDNPAALATSLAPALEPVARRARRRESDTRRLALDLAYFGLTAAALPLALAEAAARRGATIMLEARKC